MKLQDKLDQIREGFAKQAPAEAISLMHDSTRMLQRSGLADRSIHAGETMPDFNMKDTEGNFVSLGELIEEGPLVISFFRGFWWPYCVAELDALNKVVDDIRALGAELIVVSPQTDAHSRKMVEEHDLKYKILHDPNLALADTIGIAHTLPEDLQKLYAQFGINLPEANGEDGWRLPMPARYILDQTGVIRDRHVHADYTIRPEPEEIVGILRELAANAA